MADELTVERLQQRVARNLGWMRPTDWPAALPITEVANEAGEWLVSAYDWTWLTRPVTYLALVNGQEFCELPEDFSRYLSIASALNSPWAIRIEGPTQVAAARARNLGREASFVGCFTWGSPTTAGPKAVARLDIGPVPTQSVAQAFVLAYKGGWTTVNDASDHIVVPAHVTAIYVRAVSAFVGGYEQETKGTLEDRLDRLMASGLWQAAIDRDESVQGDLGRIQGGVGEAHSIDDEYPFNSNPGSIPIVVN